MVSLRAAGLPHDTLVSEITPDDERFFDERADPVLATTHMHNSRKMQVRWQDETAVGNSVVALLESQLVTAQHVLAMQHMRVMKAVEQYVSTGQIDVQTESESLRTQHQMQKNASGSGDNLGPLSAGTGETPPQRTQTYIKPMPTPTGMNLAQQSPVAMDCRPSSQHKAFLQLPQPQLQAKGNPEPGSSEDDRLKRNEGYAKKSAKQLKRSATRAAMGNTQQEAKQLIKDHKKEDDGEKKKQEVKAVFVDAAAMKEKVKEAVMKPEYDVKNFYKTKGICQKIARSTFFDNLTVVIIGLNAIWIAIDTDHNSSPTLVDAHLVFQIGENSFCFYFAGEVLIRFMAFAHKPDCMKDAWFMFDTALVIMMICETWILNCVFWVLGGDNTAGLGNASVMRLVRLLRLTRMTRMVRLLRALPELMILVKGISVATRSVFFTLCLLVTVIYIFAIAFTQLALDTPLEKEYFASVPASMNTLLLKGTLPDLAELVNNIGDENWGMAAMMLLFILISTLTVMNMLVGVLCEVVSVVSAVEKEQMTVQFVKTKLLSLLEDTGIDQDGNKLLSKREFETLLLMPEGARIIQEVGVDVVGLVDFADHIFKDGVELSFPDFMELVLQLRGSNTATVRDVVDLRKFVTTQLHEELETSIHRIVGDLMYAMTSQSPTAGVRGNLRASDGGAGQQQLVDHERLQGKPRLRQGFRELAPGPSPVYNGNLETLEDVEESIVAAIGTSNPEFNGGAIQYFDNNVRYSSAYGQAQIVRELGPSSAELARQQSDAGGRPNTGNRGRPRSAQGLAVAPAPSPVAPTQSRMPTNSQPVPAFPATMWLNECEV